METLVKRLALVRDVLNGQIGDLESGALRVVFRDAATGNETDSTEDHLGLLRGLSQELQEVRLALEFRLPQRFGQDAWSPQGT